jgi:hypothetical protein
MRRQLASTLGLALALASLGHTAACVGRSDAGTAASDAGPARGASAAYAAAPLPTAPAAAALPAASAARGGMQAEQADPGLCAAICARSESLHCPEAASCVRRCEMMRAMPACQAEVRGALGCFASVGPGDWTCNEHGLPSVRVGMCDAEQSRATRCLAANPVIAPR